MLVYIYIYIIYICINFIKQINCNNIVNIYLYTYSECIYDYLCLFIFHIDDYSNVHLFVTLYQNVFYCAFVNVSTIMCNFLFKILFVLAIALKY